MSERQERVSPSGERLARNGGKHAPDAGWRLVAHFARAGFQHADVPVLQPVEPFLELSGEDIRRRLFVTSNEAGAEMCLRPEFTIPAARAYLAGGVAGRRADLAFLGPVFRHRPGESGEFVQFGAESFGRKDREAADADMLAETLAALGGTGDLAIRIGDLQLFADLLAALSLHPVWERRLGLALSEGRIDALLDAAGSDQPKSEARGLTRYSGVLDALKGADPQEAKAFVKDLLRLAGISAVGGRSAEDIASRFLDRAREDTQPLGSEQATIIRRFLAISGDADTVAGELRALSDEAGLALAPAIDRFELRTGFIAARGLPLERITAAAGFARNLDYYSGFCFDVRRPGLERPVAAGGRYDRLFERLGAEVPAVGVAIWIERLAGGAV
jgi:ATP phosphoribosyltransferase regulatory subunit